jgi:hypothetical protein
MMLMKRKCCEDDLDPDERENEDEIKDEEENLIKIEIKNRWCIVNRIGNRFEEKLVRVL